MFYRRLQEKFLTIATQNNLMDEEITIRTKILKTVEAIGNPDRQDYPLLKGKEFLMEAAYGDAKGQAYTDAPSEFTGPLADIVQLELNSTQQRALFIASLNAIMRHLEPDLGTVHCKNNEPEECATEIGEFVEKLNPAFVGLVGLQPAILESLVARLGPDKVTCVDRDEEFRGKIKFGVPIVWGDSKALAEMSARADLILATGSTIVNGSLPEILAVATAHDVPVHFYGTTVAGAAHLLGLNRLCYRPT
jgi:hypothetical protein